MINDPLRLALQELVREIGGDNIRLIIAGGYGLLLRIQAVQSGGQQTRLPSLPVVRGTEDVDCFLSAEIILDGTKTEMIRSALDRLGYTPLVKYFQFTRAIPGRSGVTKFDFLAGPLPPGSAKNVKVSAMRVRPRSFGQLHAYLTPDAFAIEEHLTAVDIGDDHETLLVYLPSPYSLLLLKLMAFRDRIDETDPNRAKYHALDMFILWGSLTESEWSDVTQLSEKFADHPITAKARIAWYELFGSLDGRGFMALRDQARRQAIDLTEEMLRSFQADISTLMFPSP